MIVTEACEGNGSGGPGSSTEVLPRSHTDLLVNAYAHEPSLFQRDTLAQHKYLENTWRHKLVDLPRRFAFIHIVADVVEN